jgi:chaperonin cofactor prefoldin
MLSVQQVKAKKKSSRRNLWLEKLLAIIACANLLLVGFDLSYIPWRDFYFAEAPTIVRYYDQIKGIEPHRETQRYLNKVDQLETQFAQLGLQSPEVESVLQELRQLSNEMIEDNPFDVAGRTGSLAKIKRLMRIHVASFNNCTIEASAHEAFTLFWSQLYLSQVGFDREINFFNTQLRPLIATNYYRDIGENSQFVDKFWLIDLPFITIFAIDFLIRTFFISLRNRLSLLEAMLRRWYDILLLLPFLRWLRIIPVTTRLYQSQLLNLEPVRSQINHDFVANFAEEITEVVGIRVIDQLQDAIKNGNISRWLLRSKSGGYVDINNTNEISAIASRIVKVSVYQVIPKIQPEVEALIHYNLQTILSQSPVYKQLHNLPGVSNLPKQLASEIAKSAYSAIVNTIEDSQSAKMWQQLTNNFSKTLEVELQKEHNLKEIQTLLVDLLEEIKINYVQNIADGGMEEILEESEQIRRIKRRK